MQISDRYLEDPTVAQTAALEYERVWARIAGKVERGAWFYQAREQVLAEELLDIRKAYGEVVAKRVGMAIQRTPPAQLPKDSRDSVKDANRRTIETHLLATRGRIGVVNRLWLRLFGVHLV